MLVSLHEFKVLITPVYTTLHPALPVRENCPFRLCSNDQLIDFRYVLEFGSVRCMYTQAAYTVTSEVFENKNLANISEFTV